MVGDEKRTIRFHDYHEIYEVPGLYEHIFHDHLECASPEEVIGLLAEQLVAAEVDPATLTALDVGAGNGLVGEQIAAPRRAVDRRRRHHRGGGRGRRARPAAVYDDYVVCDLTALDDDQRARLGTPTLMTTVAALGFDDIPPEAFSEAYAAAADGAWIAFNIKADFLEENEETGFRGLIRRMVRDGALEILASRRYIHRLSTAGEPLEYVAVVGRKRTA